MVLNCALDGQGQGVKHYPNRQYIEANQYEQQRKEYHQHQYQDWYRLTVKSL